MSKVKIHTSQLEQFLNNHEMTNRPISKLELRYERHKDYFKRPAYNDSYLPYFLKYSPELKIKNYFNPGDFFLEIRNSKNNEILCRNLYQWIGLLIYVYQNRYSIRQLREIQDELSIKAYNELTSYSIYEADNELKIDIVITDENGNIKTRRSMSSLSFCEILPWVTADVSRNMFDWKKVREIMR